MMLYLKTYWHVGVILWFLIPTLLKAILIPTNSITFTKKDKIILAQSCKIGTSTSIGRNSSVGEGTQIKNSVIGRNCTIGRNML